MYYSGVPLSVTSCSLALEEGISKTSVLLSVISVACIDTMTVCWGNLVKIREKYLLLDIGDQSVFLIVGSDVWCNYK